MVMVNVKGNHLLSPEPAFPAYGASRFFYLEPNGHCYDRSFYREQDV